MVAEVRSRLPGSPSSRDKVDALRRHLYEAGPWNSNQPFRYDLDGDPMGHDIQNKLLPTYLATKRGNCVSMPLLFIVLGQKLGIDVTAAAAPEHVFVKYRDETDRYFNLEATSGAGVTSDVWIRSQMPMTDQAVANGIYLRPLSKKETVIVMLDTLMESYRERGQYDDVISLGKLVLEHSPRDVTSMLHIHSAYGRMIQEKFESRYASPMAIPPSERAYFVQLDEAGQSWRAQAEALGWREPDEETNARYLERVNRAKSAQ